MHAINGCSVGRIFFPAHEKAILPLLWGSDRWLSRQARTASWDKHCKFLLSELCISCSFAIVKRITSRNVFYILSSYCIDKDRAKDKWESVGIPQDGGRMRGKQIPSAVFALEEVFAGHPSRPCNRTSNRSSAWSGFLWASAFRSIAKMMCDIMPTISEDPPEIHYGQNEETNFEQLMVNMLDERDKLMETLRETQDSLALTRAKLTECQKEKDGLMNHLESVLNDVRSSFACVLISILPCSELWPFILWHTQIRHIWSVIECHFMERVFTHSEHTASTVQVRVYFQHFYKKPFLLGTALFKSEFSQRYTKFQNAWRISRLYCWSSELHSSTRRSKIPFTL